MDVQKWRKTTLNYVRRQRKTSVFTVFSGFKNALLRALIGTDALSEKKQTPVFTAFLALFGLALEMCGLGPKGRDPLGFRVG